jgi:hypothetical protein
MTNDDPNELALFVPTYLSEVQCLGLKARHRANFTSQF